MWCMECGVVLTAGEEAMFISDMTSCLSCTIDRLIARIEKLEERVEELEVRNGIAVPV